MRVPLALVAVTALVSGFALSGTLPAEAATLTVTNLNDGGAGSLRAAIATASPGDSITFQPGLTGQITLTTGPLLFDKSLSVDGTGHGITVNGNAAATVVTVGSGAVVVLSGLTISGGSNVVAGTPVGGGIQNQGTLTVTGCTITANTAGIGGGIANVVGGSLTVQDSTITGNTALGSGGGISNAGTLTVRNSTISGNSAAGSAGGILSTGTASVVSSTLSTNSSGTGGGAIANGGGGTLSVTGSTIVGNSASDNGGGLLNDSPAVIVNSTITGNRLTNDVSSSGGGIANFSTLALTNVTIADNVALFGGGVANADRQGVSQVAVNTLVAGNTPTDVAGFGLGTPSFPPPHNLVGGGTAGVLAALADNGGPTQTRALIGTAQTNTAIGGGDATACAASPVLGVDQRGYPRLPSTCDIGAFQTQPTPTLVSLSPSAGPASGGQQVTVTGTGLTPGATVKFGAVSSPAVSWVSDTQLTATTPSGAGTVTVSVTNPDNQVASLPQAYTYISPPPVVGSAPIVVTQPVDATATAAASVTFTAAATGTPTPTAQWQSSVDGGQSWLDIPGATSGTLTLTGVTLAQSGSRYRAVFTNSVGSATTTAATLSVTAPPVTSGTVTVISPKPGSAISSGGYFGVTATTTGVPAGSTAYLTLNGLAKAKSAVTADGSIRIQWVPAETGDYAVRIGPAPAILESSKFRLDIKPFGITAHDYLPVPSGAPPTVQFTIATGNWARGTTITLTRDGRATANVTTGAVGTPVTLAVPAGPGRYQVRVNSRQGFVYGMASGVVTLT